MELKNGYKQTETGMIPEDWKNANLSELANLTSSKRIFEDDYVDYGVPFFRGKEISLLIAKKQIDDVLYITQEKYNSIKNRFGVPAKGDILITAVGTLGNSFLIPDDIPFYFKDGNLIWLRNINNIDSGYLLRQLERLKSKIIEGAIGSSQKALTIIILKKLGIPYPTINEQKAIAKALSDIDALITQIEKLIKKNRLIKQGAMQKLLNPFDGNGELKNGWTLATYGEVFDFMSTAAYSRANLGDTGCGYIHYGDIHTLWDNHIELNKTNLPKINLEMAKPYTLLKNGDVIMADASENYDGVGKSIEIKGVEDIIVISGLHTFLLRDKKERFVNGFRGYIHQISIVKRQLNQLATGLKVYGVSKNNLKKIEIPVPPQGEQVKITKTLEDMDSEILAIESKLRKTKQLKKGMMQSLLTGKIRFVKSQGSKP